MTQSSWNGDSRRPAAGKKGDSPPVVSVPVRKATVAGLS